MRVTCPFSIHANISLMQATPIFTLLHTAWGPRTLASALPTTSGRLLLTIPDSRTTAPEATVLSFLQSSAWGLRGGHGEIIMESTGNQQTCCPGLGTGLEVETLQWGGVTPRSLVNSQPLLGSSRGQAPLPPILLGLRPISHTWAETEA